MTTSDRKSGSPVRPPLPKGDDGSANQYPPRVADVVDREKVRHESIGWLVSSAGRSFMERQVARAESAGALHIAHQLRDWSERLTSPEPESKTWAERTVYGDTPSEDGERWSSIEDYDRQRDDALTDDRFGDYGPATGDPRA